MSRGAVIIMALLQGEPAKEPTAECAEVDHGESRFQKQNRGGAGADDRLHIRTAPIAGWVPVVRGLGRLLLRVHEGVAGEVDHAGADVRDVDGGIGRAGGGGHEQRLAAAGRAHVVEREFDDERLALMDALALLAMTVFLSVLVLG